MAVKEKGKNGGIVAMLTMVSPRENSREDNYLLPNDSTRLPFYFRI